MPSLFLSISYASLRRPQMSTFSTVPPDWRMTPRNVLQTGSDGALLELGVEDHHHLVMTHGRSPPVVFAATVSPWQEGCASRGPAYGLPVPAGPRSQDTSAATPLMPLVHSRWF